MLVEVALPVPLPRTFTYRTETPIAAGSRVHVRFGGRRLTGWVTGETPDERQPKNLRDIETLLEPTPSVPADLLELCRWIADYYLTPIGLVLRTALPLVLSGAVRLEQPLKKRSVVRLVRELPSLRERDELFGRAARQRELYELLESTGGHQDLAQLTTQLGFTHALVRGLVKRELAVVEEEAVSRDPFATAPTIPAPTLTPTPAQHNALLALLGALRGRDTQTEAPAPFLLHGVTGSGKTLI